MILQFMNTYVGRKDSKIRNALTLMVVCVVVLNILGTNIPKGRVYSLLEMLIIWDLAVIFISNILSWTEF